MGDEAISSARCVNRMGVLKKPPCHSEGVHMDKLRDRRICLIHMEILRFAPHQMVQDFTENDTLLV